LKSGEILLPQSSQRNRKERKGSVKQLKSIEMDENELTRKIIGLAIEIHKSLGPGLLESSYKECLYYRLKMEGYFVEKEKPMPLIYREVKLDCGYRIDILVGTG